VALTAIYDGHCVICNTTRRVVGALDWFKQVEFLDLHDRTQVSSRFPALDQSNLMGEIHVLDSNLRVFPGFTGTRRMLRALPLGLPLWAILRLPFIGDWVGPRMYRFIAKNRYAINRLVGVDLDQLEREEADCIDGVCKIPQR